MKNKKYVLLFSATLLAIAGIVLSKPLLIPSVTAVTLYEVEPKTVEDTITCTGRVEAAESKEVFTDLPCIAEMVSVKAGDMVEEGDVLFTVDVSATKEVIATAAGISPSLVPEQQIQKTITAPISGVVRTLNVAEGEAVDSETPCAVISSGNALQVKVTIHENNLKDIAVGQIATVSGTAFSKKGYAGTVSYIAPSARQQYSGTSSETVVDAIITLNERDESIKPGLSAKSKIRIGDAVERVVVPYEYVLQDDLNQEYVYVLENGYAVKRVIETGKEWTEGFEIESGLVSGERIIANPTDIQKPGERVTIGEEGGAHA